MLSPAAIEVIGLIGAGCAPVVIVEGKIDNEIVKQVASMMNFRPRFFSIDGISF